MVGSRRSSGALAAICAFVLVVGAWNIVRYPPGKGFDALEHMAYADGLVPGGDLPHGVGEYYTPPGYYALAGSLDWVAGKAGIGDPHRAGMAINVLFLLGTVLVVWRIGRELVPGRERVAVGAAAFVALLPVDVRSAAMFHPAMAALFFCSLALWLSVRTFSDRRYAFALALGVALGVAQLVLAAALWTVVAVAAALALGSRWRALAVTIALAVVIPLPWYIHQQTTYSGLAPFPRPPTPEARAGGTEAGKPKPLYSRRPARFYVDPGIPDVVTHPYRPHFLNLLVPTTYAELWGDWEGHWEWRGTGSPSSRDRATLELQSIVGVLPTILAFVGWLGLLVGSWRSPARLAIALLPGLGLLGYLYFTVAYPTSDGDVLKASYMLTTAAAWALAFGYALERVRGRTWLAVAGALGLCAVVELPFLVYG